MSSRNLSLRVTAGDMKLSDIRGQVRQWFGEAAPSGGTDRHELILTELVTNARSASAEDHPIDIVVQRGAGDVEILVTNHGAAFDHLTDRPTPGMEPGGRGLPIVRQLASELDAWVEHDTVTVRAVVPDN